MLQSSLNARSCEADHRFFAAAAFVASTVVPDANCKTDTEILVTQSSAPFAENVGKWTKSCWARYDPHSLPLITGGKAPRKYLATKAALKSPHDTQRSQEVPQAT